jgi:hypothetical protein
MQMQYVRVVLAVGCVATMLGCRNQVGAGDEASLRESEPLPYSASARRVRMPSGTLGKDYRRAMKGSVEVAEQFILDHPTERDFCAGALLHIASLQARQDKKKAIASYQKAIDEYGEELIPNRNGPLIVADDASFKIARLECDMGNREKALATYGRLMKSSDSNTRSRGRRKYLSLKQSHLKLKATVSVPKKRFTRREGIPVSVRVENPGKETAVFKCFVSIKGKRSRAYGVLASINGSKEITLKPGEVFNVTYTVTEKAGLEPAEWVIKCDLGGIPFETNSEIIKIVRW